ncbi:MAG: TonB-dependent receptor, partial [Rhizorhabdus sp.]|nr:TonB-dependent receptor [Rhizorhabdus sp.]
MNAYIVRNLAMSASALAMFASASPLFAQTAPQAAAAEENSSMEDIVVTARRREESAQSVPISVTALSGERLQTATVQSLNDLTALAPGIRMSSEGGGGVSTISLRGLSKTPVGETLPAVVIYFAEVALPNQGVDIPTYDLGNIQVLKGPQGTLFGRNTIGGAILMTPQAPTYNFNGYAKATVGDFNLRAFEAALNVPIISDRVALRVAGQIRRRDGTVNIIDGKDARNIHQQSLRASLLIEPLDGLTNTTIVDYFDADEIPNPGIIYKNQVAAFAPTMNALVAGQNASGRFPAPLSAAGYLAALGAAADAQIAMGPFKTRQSIPNFITARESLGIVNTTRFDLSDNLYIKNIFGFRKSKLDITSQSDGLPLIFPTTGFQAGLDVLTGGLKSKRELMSNELQLQGSTLGGVVDFIAGGIYTEDKPVGAENGNYGPRFQFGGTIAPSVFGPALSSFITSKSYAVFGQVGIDLSDIVVSGLKLNLGYRQTWDKIKA